MKTKMLLHLIGVGVLLPGLASADVFDIVYSTDPSMLGGPDVSVNIEVNADFVSPGVFVINPGEGFSGSGTNPAGALTVASIYPAGGYSNLTNDTPDNLINVTPSPTYFSNDADTNGFAYTDSAGNQYAVYYCANCAFGAGYYEYSTAYENASGNGTLIDLTVLTPEPSTVLLTGGGIVALGFLKRRKRA